MGVIMNYPNDSLKSIQNAWYKQLVNFRAWYMPETQLTADWKMRAIGNAIKACPSRMMDDSEAMLSEYRKSQTHGDNSKVQLPIMLTATALTDQPPDVNQLLPVPDFVETVIDEKRVKVRLVPTTVRAQIAFFATNPNDLRSVIGQFCAYMSSSDNRRFNVPFQQWNDHVVNSTFTVFENELFPSPVPSEAVNLSISTVDIQLVGYTPNVIGFGGPFDQNTGNGYEPDGSATEQPAINDKVVVQADQYTPLDHQRVKGDRETGEITVERIDD